MNAEPYVFAYPTGWWALLLKLPIVIYRLGLGRLLSFNRFMILTTRGRRTGLARHTVLEYRRHGSKTYVISGWGEQPQWVQNLAADPDVTIQQGGQVGAARAQIVENSGEALRVLHLFRRAAPFMWDAIISKMSDRPAMDVKTLPEVTSRFTIIRLDEQPGDAPLRPVPNDLSWMLTIGLVTSIGALVLALVTRTRRDA